MNENFRPSLVAAATLAALALAACGSTADRIAAQTTTPPASSSSASPSTPSTAPSTTGTTPSSSPATDAMTKAGNALDDTAITAKVKSAMIAEPGLKSMQIDVDTKGAVVTLSGTVDSAAQKEKARAIAQGVSGVQSVVDHLTTKSQP